MTIDTADVETGFEPHPGAAIDYQSPLPDDNEGASVERVAKKTCLGLLIFVSIVSLFYAIIVCAQTTSPECSICVGKPSTFCILTFSFSCFMIIVSAVLAKCAGC
ncbi:hypothetical protein KDA11_04650 [Candidatus Saccharibacteria bacterium]|nr:hypothetical protein [Candidatus Saccharibacteria bacterium]